MCNIALSPQYGCNKWLVSNYQDITKVISTLIKSCYVAKGVGCHPMMMILNTRFHLDTSEPERSFYCPCWSGDAMKCLWRGSHGKGQQVQLGAERDPSQQPAGKWGPQSTIKWVLPISSEALVWIFLEWRFSAWWDPERENLVKLHPDLISKETDVIRVCLKLLSCGDCKCSIQNKLSSISSYILWTELPSNCETDKNKSRHIWGEGIPLKSKN